MVKFITLLKSNWVKIENERTKRVSSWNKVSASWAETSTWEPTIIKMAGGFQWSDTPSPCPRFTSSSIHMHTYILSYIFHIDIYFHTCIYTHLFTLTYTFIYFVKSIYLRSLIFSFTMSTVDSRWSVFLVNTKRYYNFTNI